MSKLEELKNLIADMFAKAETKTDVENMTVLNKLTEDAVAEQNKLQEENKELLKDYKELVAHTSFKDSSKAPVDQISAQPLSFEEALKNFK